MGEQRAKPHDEIHKKRAYCNIKMLTVAKWRAKKGLVRACALC